MSGQHLDPQSPDEQQTVTQSPIEEEIRETEPDRLSASDQFTLFGYSIGIVLTTVFILFVFLIVLVLLLR